MPAPQPAMMKQLARLKFTSFNLKVPPNWQPPVGDAARLYNDAFTASEKQTVPGMPPLFQPATLNKLHTDAQKMNIATYGNFIDKMCDAICQAWSTWQSAATMTGIVVNAVTATGGQVVGPPWTPLIMASFGRAPPQALKFTTAIANTLGTAWQAYTATIKVPGLPWYPMFAAFPSPVAPPTPNIPCPIASLVQVKVALTPTILKQQMLGALAMPSAPYCGELFESILDAVDKCFTLWQSTTQVTNVLGMGPVPTFAPPVVPVGPVVGGTAMMAPGGFV